MAAGAAADRRPAAMAVAVDAAGRGELQCGHQCLSEARNFSCVYSNIGGPWRAMRTAQKGGKKIP